ncbi:TetR/AcrR family transcriptional regulator [Lacibacterium aquatile]|uniref:TetR/AcrR family transcriptional regulator n=1 Tax=Lacibacterium aquatile TaxID=1168082 RepID=A0ABW5DN97_9PROT
MQEAKRTNRDRTEQTRGALLQAARALFVEKGYAETSTPEIVAAAGITRGALYHHFADKRALFRAVVIEEAQAVAADIERTAAVATSPLDALLVGSDAYIDAMQAPGRTLLLLIDGPAVLGHREMQHLDGDHAARTLAQGLAAVSGKQDQALADLLSAAFDRAALAIESGEPAEVYRAAIKMLVTSAVR